MADRWCYIIKHSAELTPERVAYLSQDGETKMALDHLKEVSKEERERWNAISISRREWEDQLRIEEVREEVQAHGIGKVLDRITKKYRVIGREEGSANKVREIALNMLQKGYEVSEISEMTLLTVGDVEQLKNGTAKKLTP